MEQFWSRGFRAQVAKPDSQPIKLDVARLKPPLPDNFAKPDRPIPALLADANPKGKGDYRAPKTVFNLIDRRPSRGESINRRGLRLRWRHG